MTTHKCSNGHNSTESDFCSVCMEEIKPGAVPAATPKASPVAVPAAPVVALPVNLTPGSLACPTCREPHVEDDGQYCLTCGYDFVSKQAGIPLDPQPNGTPAVSPVVLPNAGSPVSGAVASGSRQSRPAVPADATNGGAVPVPVTPVATPATGAPAAVPGKGWILFVEINPSMRGEFNDQAPKVPPRTYDLLNDRNVLGRAPAAGVDIVVQRDAGISRKQVEFVRQPDGSFKVKDLDSANGTKLTCEQGRLEPFAEYPADRSLQVGDVVQIGEWTQVTIKQRG